MRGPTLGGTCSSSPIAPNRSALRSGAGECVRCVRACRATLVNPTVRIDASARRAGPCRDFTVLAEQASGGDHRGVAGQLLRSYLREPALAQPDLIDA